MPSGLIGAGIAEAVAGGFPAVILGLEASVVLQPARLSSNPPTMRYEAIRLFMINTLLVVESKQ